MGKNFMGYNNASELITAIGNKIKAKYSKPSGGIPKTDLASAVQASLGLADSALQSETDPTVPSWAKQTNKPTYNSDEISDANRTHKFATAAQLTQIETNQTNILYVLGKTGKNLLDISDFKSYKSNVGTWSGNTFTPTSAPNITFTINSDYTVTVNGSTPSGTAVVFIISANKGIKAGSYVLSGCPSGGSQTTFDLRYYKQSTGAITADTGNSANITVDDGAYNVAILIRGGQTVSSKVFKPMVCTPEDWAVGHDYAPYALPNSDLTYLEAEDRAALAEEIDSGAKNKLPIDLAHIQSINTVGTWSNNVYTIDNVTITVNSNKTITLNGTSNGIFEFQLTSRLSGNFKLDTGNYTFNNSLAVSTGGNWDIAVNRTVSGSGVRYGSDTGSGLEFTVTDASANTGVWIACNIPGTVFSNVTIKPMICTRAEFDVSQKFVPCCRIPKVIANLYKEIAGSTTLTNTGLECKVESGAKYRITAYAEYGGSNPLEIVICQSNGVVLGQESISPASGTTIGYVVATGYIHARNAVTITLKARFASATTNYVGMIVEKL